MSDTSISAALGLAFDIGHIRKIENQPLNTKSIKPKNRERFNNLLCLFFYTRWPDKYIKFRHVLHNDEFHVITGNPQSGKVKSYEFEGLCGEKYIIDGWTGIYASESGKPLLEVVKISESDGSECFEHTCYFELDEDSVIPPSKGEILDNENGGVCYPRLNQDVKDLKAGKELYSGPMFHGGR